MMNSSNVNNNNNQLVTSNKKQSSSHKNGKEGIITIENINHKTEDIAAADRIWDEDTFEGKLLHLSCIWNNPELLSDLLLGDEAKNINSQDGKGRTALHEAVISDSIECARLLLANGADVNKKQFNNPNDTDMLSKSSLHLAAAKGNLEMVRLLLQFNADPFQKDANGFTALDIAELNQHLEVIDEIKTIMNEQESNIYKLLAIAVHKGDKTLVMKLISDNDNDNDKTRLSTLVNYVPHGSNTLLFKACQEGHLEIAKCLILAGADGRQHPINKYSPLYIAAYHGRLQICQLLLEFFPELSSECTAEQWLPIHAAVINNHDDIVQLLLNYSYPTRLLKPFLIEHSRLPLSQSITGTTATRITGTSGSTSSNSLSTSGNISKCSKNSKEETDCDNNNNHFVYFMPFDINAQDIVGQTILYLATLVGNQLLVDYLLNFRIKTINYDERRPDLYSLTNDNDDLFDDDYHSSNSNSSPDITVIHTIDNNNKKSSQINSQIVKNKTKLSLEPKQQCCSLSRKLLSNENVADFQRNNNNNTTIEMESKYNLINPIKIDLYCNHNVETALHCAVKKRHYAIASILLENGADPNNPIHGIPGTSPIVSRISSNLFGQKSLSLSESFKDFKNILDNGNETEVEDIFNSGVKEKIDYSNIVNNSTTELLRCHSTALREAIKNRDKAMVDLLLRFGARDTIDTNNTDEHDDINCDNNNSALAIAFTNQDFHFVSKLLSLKAYPDSEFKVNKKSFDINGSNCMNALNHFHMVNNLTVSSMFPSNSVMIDWHCLKINSLDEYFHKHLTEWLIDCSLAYNVKLKLSHVHDSGLWNTALAAITRIDLSENNLSSVPIALFTDLPSLKILNLSKNRLQTLPEIKANLTEKTHDDNSVSIFRTSTPINDHILPPSQCSSSGGVSKKPRKLFSMMPKSQSVTASLSNVANTNIQDRAKSAKSTLKNNRSIDCAWNLPCLEELYLQDNQLECLPLSLFQQAELKILDLSNNKLRTLPPLFWFAPKLSELNLSLNLLCELPSPVNCLNQMMTLETNPNSPTTATSTMSKSVSTSSISSNFKFDYETKNFQTTLLPFELNILKFWSGNVTILDNPFTEQFDNNKMKMSTVNSQDSSTKSINGSNLMKNSNSCSLTQLNLSHNGFNRIPFFLSCLATRLTHLNISYNRLKSIFDPIYILGHFPLSLKHLDLSHNQISEWLYVDEDLEMDIGDDLNGFETPCLHTFLWLQKSANNPTLEKHCPFKKHTKLDNLKTLILSNNSLSNIIITREELNEWIDLELMNNRYIDSIRNNYTTNLSSSFGEYSKHSSAALSSTSMNSKFYSNFGSQDELNLNNDININYKATRYSKLFFPNLSMLDISHNYLVQIPKTISYLYQLSVFNFSGNSTLTSLPPEMGLLTKLWNLNTRGCNLGEPLQTMINSKSYKTCDIISYLNSILENSKPYNRLKLMIVGYQNIGKTSLLEQLRHEGHSRRGRATPDHWGKRIGNKSVNMKTQRGVSLSTVGVDLCEWTYEYRPLKSSNIRDRSLSRSRIANLQNSTKNSLLDNHSIGPITFRTWDFGGQREYYATHQYFLSKRSIYLVVWKITDGEKGIVGLHSWLVNIQSRAPNSPVIIVGTHYDLVKEFYPPFFSTELQNMIRERYMSDSVDADKRGLPKVVASVEVSTKTNYNIRLLANLIYETACEMRSPGGKDKLLDQKVPATYLALEELVTSMAIERKAENLEPILHSDQFRQEVAHLMKERYDLTFRDYSELQQATRFLHENGVMLHYEDAHLKDLYFLDPQWLCDMLAHVVTIREINPFVKNGIMKTEHLLQLFKNTRNSPVDVKSYLLNLLNKFELAITWDNRTLLIPSLLPTEDQLRSGYLGWDITIPLRSRLKIRNQLDQSKPDSRFEFKNQLSFHEFNDSMKNVDKINENRSTKLTESCTVTAIARHGRSIYRILLLSYVPCGFWSRLIARVLADETVIEIVRSFYCLPSFVHNDPLLIDFLNNVKSYWHCWQTGFGLRYLDTFLIRVKEISLINNTEFKINFSSNWKNASYPFDYNKIRFYLRQPKESSILSAPAIDDAKSQWSEINISTQCSSLIEIYLPNQPLQVETEILNEDNQLVVHEYSLEPNIEMLTKLLVIIVEHIDTLLEDWYPSLGTRFIHTSDGKFLITRIVPCVLCMQDFLKQQQTEINNKTETNVKEPDKAKEIVSPDTSAIDSNLVDFFKLEVKKATLQANNVNPKALNKEIKLPRQMPNDISMNKLTGKVELPSKDSLSHYRINSFMVEECILSVYENIHLECSLHGKIRIEKIAPDFVFLDLKDNYRIYNEQLKFGKLLGRGSFGFVFRGYFKPNQKTAIKESAADSPLSISNSTFYLPKNEQKNYEVAMKLLQPINLELCSNGIRKADMEAYLAMKSKWERDPLQYSCKAYCTARTELNILLTLKHPNIASIIGVCPKPLALVLTLAPHGSLDGHTKAYRRSGTRISALILQKTFLQVSKALEYLHQQHIIYRDLKSENVLVWSFPLPYTNHPHLSSIKTNQLINDEVILKLADYGISRSSLPTGTKGFGGTEGFMAPEIMLFNGEEEYTEKVDCFSFAMFMYELATLRFPFEGQEFAIRESILDGIRPSISQKDLEYLPESFIDLMTRTWAHEPSDRPTMSQIVSIISAPEFCSLRDVATLSDNCSLICAIGFRKNEPLESNKKRFGLLLSKIGKQIDILEIDGSKWSPIGQRLSCENLKRRTITSVCLVNDNQLWLGDSNACINVYCFNEYAPEDPFQLICLIQLEFENPASLTAIKSICWLAKVNLVAICSNDGEVWLLSLKNLLKKLETIIDCDITIPGSSLGMKKIIDNNNLRTFCIANVSLPSMMPMPTECTTNPYIDLWVGQTEGKIAILSIKLSNLEVVRQTTIDHYADSHFNQLNVPIEARNDVYLLVGANDQPFICSVLYSGYIIYQWDILKRTIVHKLDCSKLAPCSESLMSISIEDHLKPGNCQISEVAINNDNDEIYLGTNFGCIIVAELRSLKPITVFRPYQREVKFIITLNNINENYLDSNNETFIEEENQTPVINEKIEINKSESRQQQLSLQHPKIANSFSAIKNIWPFNKSNVENKNKFTSIEQPRNTIGNLQQKKSKSVQPFVTIGRGYRNLLDRFINSNETRTSESNYLKLNTKAIKLKDASQFYAIIWDSGFWNFS